MDTKHEHASRLWLQTRPAEELAIRRVLAGKGASFDRLARPVVVTAFGGHYEEPAGYTVALNGSPVQAVIVFIPRVRAAVLWQNYRSRRLGKEDTQTIDSYLESLHMPAPVTNRPYPFVMFVDGERVEGDSFHVKTWFWRSPELYARWREETPGT